MKRMLLSLSLCLGSLALSTPLRAQQPSLPAGLPQFPLPKDFTPTPPALSVSGSLLKAIREKFECQKCNGQEPGGRVGALMVKLGALGPAALVTSYSPDHCGDTGSCSIWLFYSEGGAVTSYQIDWGASFTLPTTTPKPVPDIAIRGVTGDRREFVHLFSYLNGHYIATGCDALWDKNDMGDVAISACK